MNSRLPTILSMHRPAKTLDTRAKESAIYWPGQGTTLRRSHTIAGPCPCTKRSGQLHPEFGVSTIAQSFPAGIAKMQANLGNKAIALGECSKVSALLNEIPEVPESRLQSGARAQINMHLAKVYATLATSRIMTGAEQRKYWRAARNIYARSLEIWQEMETRGILTGEYAAKPREVAREIARCDSFLRN
jgi:hypothetical protein